MAAAWRNPFTGREKAVTNTRLVLDIGTEFIKALIVENDGGVPRILGTSRMAQDYSNMEGGAIADIEGVAEKAVRAYEEAAVLAKQRPKQAVIGLAGELVKGIVKTVTFQRRNPNREITLREIARLVKGIEQEGLETSEKELRQETGYEQVDIELVNSAVVNVRIDGYRVSNPIGFQGRNLEITLFAAYAPLVHIGAVRSVAEEMGCELVHAVAEPYAVASATLTDEVYEFGSLIIDVGGGSTDIALVQNKGIVGTKMIAFGGRAFTRSIAARLGLSLKEAEEKKLDYSQGVLEEEEHQEIAGIIERDLKIYTEALALALKDLAEDALPNTILLCGGGSCLPGISKVFSRPELADTGLFAHPPVVYRLNPGEISGVVDDKQFLTDAVDVTPKCLAFNAFVEQGIKGLLSEGREREVSHGIGGTRGLSR